MRRSQRLFALLCTLLLVTAALSGVMYAQDDETTTESNEDNVAVIEAAPATAAPPASAPPGITLLIFGIGVGFVIMVGSVLIFREQYESKQGRTPSL